MNLEDYTALCNLDNEMIEDKLKEGAKGIEFLLENSNEDDMHLYPKLLEFAGVKTKEEARRFAIDSLKMDSDDFFNKYQVNFWTSRDMNIQVIADEYKQLNAFQKAGSLEALAKILK